MNQYIGYLIRQKRLEQNLSQEGLCSGICVVSYLSKIEQGLVNSGEEIIEQLFSQLGIHYLTDEQKIKKMREALSGYFDSLFHEEDTTEWEKAVEEMEDDYEFSELSISWKIYEIYHRFLLSFIHGHLDNSDCFHDEMKRLEKNRRYMDRNQLFLFAVMMGMSTNLTFEERLHWYGVAQQQIPCSYILHQQGHLYFVHGKYLEAIRFLEQAYQAAAEEGNAKMLLGSSFMLATCYTNHDQSNMLRYYRRTMELARVIQPELMHSIYYNIGATYVEHGQYEEAIQMLKRVENHLFQWEEEHQNQTIEEMERNNFDWLLLYHKLSFSYMQLHDLEQSRYYLQEGYKRICEYSNQTVIKMLKLIEMRQEPGFEDRPEYEVLLKEVFDVVGDEFGYGFRKFHGRFLVGLYKHKRRYKEALELSEEINNHILYQSITDKDFL